MTGVRFPQARSRGWSRANSNHTFRLGDALKVRLPSAERYVPQVAKEARWLPRLASHLPLRVPVPLAVGAPGEGCPWPWTVQPWIEGETLAACGPGDGERLAGEVAVFLRALWTAPAEGPEAGAQNFHRGGDLAVYDGETRAALATSASAVDACGATDVWTAALAAPWQGQPVWVHGDIAAGNLLLRDGRLSAVIDWGSAAVGDPACDLSSHGRFFRPRGAQSSGRSSRPIPRLGRGHVAGRCGRRCSCSPRGRPPTAGERPAAEVVAAVIADHAERFSES
jgi:aminoglycoside phosphotransferase (APT) family kinase protein